MAQVLIKKKKNTMQRNMKGNGNMRDTSGRVSAGIKKQYVRNSF